MNDIRHLHPPCDQIIRAITGELQAALADQFEAPGKVAATAIRHAREVADQGLQGALTLPQMVDLTQFPGEPVCQITQAAALLDRGGDLPGQQVKGFELRGVECLG
ncbi:hypothetical protein D3C85_1027570 [compost metagenome]